LGLNPLRAFLRKHRRIGLDTSVFIYCLESNPKYGDMACKVFAWLESAGNSAVTSTITMTELLVHPYRARNEPLVNEYYGLLAQFPNLEWVAPDLATADGAARIRALYGLRTPDALQVATAIACGASALLTNDSDIARIPDIEIGLLERFR